MSPDISTSKKLSQGFTIIDSLVGIVAISVVLVLIAPPLLLVAVTRVQHQRAEQAMQLARAEIDSARILMIKTQNLFVPVPNTNPQQFVNNPLLLPTSNDPISKTAAPQITSAITATVTNGNGVVKIIPVSSSFTPGGTDKFVVQVFRDSGSVDASNNVINFRMGVRVYGPEVLTSANIGQTLKPSSAFLGLTSILNLNSPSAVIYTEISKYDSLGASLNQYRNLINSTCNVPQKTSGICQ